MIDTGKVDLNLIYLQAELTRIDLLLHREVERWQRANQDPADTFRGFYVSDAKANELLARPFNHSWGDLAVAECDEEDDEIAVFAQLQHQAIAQCQTIVEQAQAQGQPLRLLVLADLFELAPFERDVLLICLAPMLDQGYEQIYGYLQDNVNLKRPSVNLLLNLLAPPGLARLSLLARFIDENPLFKNELLIRITEAGSEKPSRLTQTLQVDQTVVDWLLGQTHPHPELADKATLTQPAPDPLDRLLAEPMINSLADIAARKPAIICYGPDQASQDAAARLLAVETNRPLLSIDLAALINQGMAPLRCLRLALRDARLAGAIPYFTGWDRCLVDETLPGDLLHELCHFADLVIVSGRVQWQARGIAREQRLHWLECATPGFEQRQQIWHHFLSRSANQPVVESRFDLINLAGQFVLTTEQIRDAIATALDAAAQANRPVQNDDLFAAARAHSSTRLSTLARKIKPRYGWDDMILPDEQRAMLSEIVSTVQGRPIVLESWGAGQKLASSRGVTIMFAGPPGTGKTMGAEIIAAELRLDLYKIDLSTVVSKYIGETEKNLERIFNEAQSSNAILFFDEADSLFGKRSEVKDAHDRYANLEVSYLLQRMEAYDGITILATNLRANLDDAFTRRLHFIIDFPFPTEADRLRIWQTLFPATIPCQPDVDFTLLARRFKLAGGNIRNVIMSAAYLAAANGGEVTMDYLLHGTRRELQKMGRLIGEEDLRV